MSAPILCREKGWLHIAQEGILCGMVAGAALGAAESLFVREGIQQGPSVAVVFVIFLLDLAIGVLLWRGLRW